MQRRRRWQAGRVAHVSPSNVWKNSSAAIHLTISPLNKWGRSYFFNVYGDDPEVSWETVQWRNHQGVDLKLQLITNSLTSVQVG